MDTKQAEETTQERSGCQHHWVVEPPAGPVSKGVCRSCGEERDFLNYTKGRFNIRRSDVPDGYREHWVSEHRSLAS